ncbi:MAG TPA: hypothetical protein VKV15_12020, partial [Bryobacteraceae bacterium]|nr:hypothetical protein [Bryobacteraceae bacterium]
MAKQAPAGAVVSLASSNPSVLQVPLTLSVPVSALSASASLSPSFVSADTVVTITATYAGSALPVQITIVAPKLISFNLAPTAIGGGGTVTGNVFLSCPAPTGGEPILLSSSAPLVANPPTSVIVGAGSTSNSFPINTFSVGANMLVTLTASDGVSRQTSSLTVEPIALT